MQAMDAPTAGFYEEDGKDLDFYDFEPLPTLPEDEVSPRPWRPHLPFPGDLSSLRSHRPCSGLSRW
jgi:hypothetical protein